MPRHVSSFSGAWVAVLLGFLVGCSSGPPGSSGLPAGLPPAVQQAHDQGTPVPPALVAADNGMGLAVLAPLRQAGSGNILLSPLSLAQALGMVYNGAGGQTLAGMAQAMQLGGVGPDQLDLDNAALMAQLDTADPGITFVLANSIWARADILPSFLTVNQTYFGAQVGTLDGAPGTLNAWVDQITQGRIPTLLDPGLDCSRLDAILANALYFKGAWQTPFRPADTLPAPFTRLDGSQVTCPMMNGTAPGGYGRTAQAEVAWLPYGDGRFRMVFLLPQSGVALADLAPDAAGWAALAQTAVGRNLQLTLPKVTARWAGNLAGTLAQLGMGDAFDPQRADFPGLSAVPEYLALVTQGTTVEVDETGTVATAGTGVGVAPTAVEPPVPVVLDHPFLYGIQDSGTGILLFVGQMMDPTAG